LEDELRSVSPGALIAPSVGPRFHAELNLYRAPQIGVLDISIGRATVFLGVPRDYYSITLAEAGGFDVRDNRGRVECATGSAHVLDIESSFALRSFAKSKALVLNVDRSLVDRHVAAHRRDSSAAKRAHGRLVPFATSEGAAFARQARRFLRRLELSDAESWSDFAVKEAEERLASVLVESWLGSDAIDAGALATPGWLSRAEDFISAHLREPVSVAEVARVAEVSVRTLSRGFQNRHEMGAISFLRERRFEAARNELLVAEMTRDSVTDVALRYGFHHLGRFALDYRRRFGESPSESARASSHR
jgi:AraC-like DNA-binding protein